MKNVIMLGAVVLGLSLASCGNGSANSAATSTSDSLSCKKDSCCKKDTTKAKTVVVDTTKKK